MELANIKNDERERITNEKQKELKRINQSPKEFLKPISPEIIHQ